MQGSVLDEIDKGILPAVIILQQHGFKTFESCEGSDNHAFKEPTVCFEGNEFDCIRAYSICELHKLNVVEVKRVFRKTSIYINEGIELSDYCGKAFGEPFNEIVFLADEKTGSIFLD